MRKILISTLLGAMVAVHAPLYAGGLASELAEAAIKYGFGESVEQATKTSVKAAGREALKTASKETTEVAATQLAKQAHKTIADDVLKLGGKAASLASKADDAIKVPLKEATMKLSAQQSRRLQMVLPELSRSGKAPQILELISKHGAADQVVDFLWRNKATLAGGAAVTLLLANPDQAIAAGTDVLTSAVTTTGETMLKPMANDHPFAVMIGCLGMIAIGLASFGRSRLKTWFHLTWYLFKPMKKVH